jgi:hypothetical protein
MDRVKLYRVKIGLLTGVATLVMSPLTSLIYACASVEEEEAYNAAQAIMAEESAIIAWDARTQTQHFIRRASFDTDSESLGFLVPTPTSPRIQVADDALFTALEEAIKPQVITTRLSGLRFGWVSASKRDASWHEERVRELTQKKTMTGTTGKTTPLHVMREARVGAYTATVLAARDVHAVDAWLKQNKYKNGPDLRAWLKPYVEQGWTLTAFKISPGVNKEMRLHPVSLSFKTPRPLYPYREPASARKTGNYSSARTLKVYYLGQDRPVGSIGGTKAWPGKTLWTATVPDAARKALLTGTNLDSAQLPPKARLTVFKDESSPRPGTDEVFFKTGRDQSQLLPAVIHETDDQRKIIPLELLLVTSIGVGGVACALGLRSLLRWRKGKTA